MLLLLILYVSGALVFSFLCSILEAALLSMGIPELEQRKTAGDAGAIRLLDIKQNRIDDAISAILILNTIAHTAGATLAGNEAGRVYGDDFVAVFSGILIFLVLVFTEIIPKTLGTVYASSLVGFVGRALEMLIWTMRPLLVLTRLLTGLFTHEKHGTVTRGEVAAMVAMAARQGILRSEDQRLVSNVLRYDKILVEDVMTPRTVLCAVPAESTLADFLQYKEARSFSRIPVFRETRDHIESYVLQRDVLAAVADGQDPQSSIADLAREAFSIPESLSVAQALRQITEGNHHIALVRDEFGGVSGLVSLEDLVETVLGIEIVDESDQVADLRGEAIRLRDQRLAGRHLVNPEAADEVSPEAASERP